MIDGNFEGSREEGSPVVHCMVSSPSPDSSLHLPLALKSKTVPRLGSVRATSPLPLKSWPQSGTMF